MSRGNFQFINFFSGADLSKWCSFTEVGRLKLNCGKRDEKKGGVELLSLGEKSTENQAAPGPDQAEHEV